jgi:PBP1b-binding outer membrane lipoprotein LpoB
MKILTSLIVLTFLIGGCSVLPKAKPVEVKTIAEMPPMYHPPLPLEMQLVNVKFEVITPEIMKEYLALVEEGKAPAKPYYALTTQQYENLSNNMAEITRYTNNILSIVKYYRDYDKSEKTEETGQQ